MTGRVNHSGAGATRVSVGNSACAPQGVSLAPLIVALLLIAPMVRAQNGDAKKRLRYDIKIAINFDERTYTGSEQVHWVNHGDHATSTIFFHLYPNMRPPDYVAPAQRNDAGQIISDEPRLEISEVRSAGNNNSIPFSFDDLQTTLRINLHEAIQPEGAADIQIKFRGSVPEIDPEETGIVTHVLQQVSAAIRSERELRRARDTNFTCRGVMMLATSFPILAARSGDDWLRKIEPSIGDTLTTEEADFDVTIEAPAGEEELKLRWASLRLTFWQPTYIERRGIELFDPVEDYDVGSLASMEGGMALKALGSTADEGIAKLRMDVGTEAGKFGFGLASGRFSTRIRRELLETLAQLDARWIQQPQPDLAVVVAAHGEAAQNAPREVQSVVGGLNGLRAYGVQALAGTQVWRFNGEARWVAARDLLDLASVGGAVFVDSARAWGNGADDAPWHHDAGFGLRLSFPHASLHQVARFDLAFPISPTRDGRREPVFSFGSSQAF